MSKFKKGDVIMYVTNCYPEDNDKLIEIAAVQDIDLDNLDRTKDWKNYSSDPIVCYEIVIMGLLTDGLVSVRTVNFMDIGPEVYQSMESIENTATFKSLLLAAVHNAEEKKVPEDTKENKFVSELKYFFNALRIWFVR